MNAVQARIKRIQTDAYHYLKLEAYQKQNELRLPEKRKQAVAKVNSLLPTQRKLKYVLRNNKCNHATLVV